MEQSERERLERQKEFLQAAFDRFYGGQREEGEPPSRVSVAEFARAVGIKENTMYRLMNGQNAPSFRLLLALARSEFVGPEFLTTQMDEEELAAIVHLVGQLPEARRLAPARARP
jgi:transcriptional regulator with XRE-family HTH domain